MQLRAICYPIYNITNRRLTMKYKLDDDTKQILIKQLKFYREKRTFSQDFMAERIGITQPLYNRIENGSREMTINTLIKITEILDISMDSLFAKEENTDTITKNMLALLKGKSQSDLEIVEDVMKTLLESLEKSRESAIINV